MDDSKVALYFQEADLNNDGIIHYKEFLLCIGFLFFLDENFTPAHHSSELQQVCAGTGM
jgi:hypothetical protein